MEDQKFMENFVMKSHGVQLSLRLREIVEAWYKTIAVWIAAWVPTLLGGGHLEEAGCI
jgi:ABC-type uncharacterized transport system YnjBCD permease subunit